jgi:hypothetical protein
VREHRTHRVPIDLPGMSARQDIFRVSKTSRQDPDVAAWLTGEPAELRNVARQWFLQMRACGDDVRELMHDGCPVACIADVPFGYVNSFKSHVNVGFFDGALLEDPAGMLQGSGRRMRHVKLLPGEPVNTKALSDLIVAAYRDIKNRLKESAGQSGIA